MSQPYLRRPRRRLAVFILSMSSFCAPAAWADFFVSSANFTGGDVVSFSQVTGVPKLDMTMPTPLPNYSSGLAFGPDGNLYVANEARATVLRFSPVNGTLIGTFVASGNGLNDPLGMTFGPDGNLYVADYVTGVRQFNGSTGAPMAAITTSGTGASLYAYDVKFGSDGNIYVSDDNSNAILRYNGSTLAFIDVFATPPAVSAISVSTPHGMAFDSNGELYAVVVVDDFVDGEFNLIYEFDKSTGNPSTTFGASIMGDDLTFGRDGFIYVPEGQAINRYNPEFGYFQNAFTTDSRIRGGFIAFGGPAPFDQVVYGPVVVTKVQTLRLTVVAGPVLVPPGVPVEAVLGFANEQGDSVGPSLPATLAPGQAVSIDLDASTLISSGHLVVRPVVTSPAGAPAAGETIEASVEVFDTANGIGSVFGRAAHSIPAAPSFVPQGLPYGQTMRIAALAPPDSPCDALLTFADTNGNPIGPTKNVNLNPGQIATLDFNANSITGQAGQRIEVQPMITLRAIPRGPASACEGAVEVYDQHTQRTATRQDSGGSF
jgi:sugar lactone lactonase YvrE